MRETRTQEVTPGICDRNAGKEMEMAVPHQIGETSFILFLRDVVISLDTQSTKMVGSVVARHTLAAATHERQGERKALRRQPGHLSQMRGVCMLRSGCSRHATVFALHSEDETRKRSFLPKGLQK